ncbi:hypothetical protein [Aestuariibius sp. HNIBRBA575]
MTALAHGYRGMSLLVTINWDRLLYAGTIIAALWAGAYLGSLGAF